MWLLKTSVKKEKIQVIKIILSSANSLNLDKSFDKKLIVYGKRSRIILEVPAAKVRVRAEFPQL